MSIDILGLFCYNSSSQSVNSRLGTLKTKSKVAPTNNEVLEKKMSNRMMVIEVSNQVNGGIHTKQNDAEPYPAELIAAVAESWAGWTADALQITGMSDEEVVTEVLNYGANVVGMTVFTYTADRAAKLCRMIKSFAPATITVVGGYHPSMVPSYVMEPSIDFAVIGEGEVTITELLSNLSDCTKAYGEIAGLAFESDGQLIITAKRDRIQDLDTLPWAKRYDKYLKRAGSNGITFPIREETVMAEVSCSRGCAGNCSFCISGKMWGQCVITRSVASIVEEVKYLRDTFGVNFLFLTDLTFNHSVDRVIEISKAFEAAGLHNPATENDSDHATTNVHWTCQCKVGIDMETAKIMAAGGCSRVASGVECLSEEQAKVYRKPYKGIADVVSSFRAMDAAGIINRPNMMFGCDESEMTINATIEAMKLVPCDQFRMSFATPLPGTDWAEEMGEAILDQDLSRYDTEHPVVKAAGIDWEAQFALRARVSYEYYNSGEYAAHVRAKIRNFPQLERSFRSFFHSLKVNGVADLEWILDERGD